MAKRYVWWRDPVVWFLLIFCAPLALGMWWLAMVGLWNAVGA